jgi:hypothetical protein
MLSSNRKADPMVWQASGHSAWTVPNNLWVAEWCCIIGIENWVKNIKIVYTLAFRSSGFTQWINSGLGLHEESELSGGSRDSQVEVI